MATKNWIVGAWVADAVPRIRDLMTRRDAQSVSTDDVLYELMQKFSLDMRFNFFVSVSPMHADLEAAFAEHGLRRVGDSWSFSKAAPKSGA